MANKIKDILEVITVDGFNMIYFKSVPPCLEAKVIFDRDHISQKLVFTIMNITYQHGFSCSAPRFKEIEDPSMTFMIGTFLPSARSKTKYVEKMVGCLHEIAKFSKIFINQLDFSTLDLSMFGGIDLNKFYPEQFAALRDQQYNGSWEKLLKAMEEEERFEDAEIVVRCKEFEKINNKDIGLVGHKLNYMLNLLNETLGGNLETN